MADYNEAYMNDHNDHEMSQYDEEHMHDQDDDEHTHHTQHAQHTQNVEGMANLNDVYNAGHRAEMKLAKSVDVLGMQIPLWMVIIVVIIIVYLLYKNNMLACFGLAHASRKVAITLPVLESVDVATPTGVRDLLNSVR
jgi:hypothetical protein